MKRKPKNSAEKDLRDRFENAHEEATNPKHYRQIRREIKKEMKQLERKLNKKEAEIEIREYLDYEEE